MVPRHCLRAARQLRICIECSQQWRPGNGDGLDRAAGEAAAVSARCHRAGLAVGPAAGGHLQRSSDISQSALVVVGSLMSSCHADAPWEAAK